MREAEPVRAERDFPLETFAVDPVQPVELAPRRTARASQKRRRISNLDLVDHDLKIQHISIDLGSQV